MTAPRPDRRAGLAAIEEAIHDAHSVNEALTLARDLREWITIACRVEDAAIDRAEQIEKERQR